MRAAGITDPAEVQRHIDARVRRQQILTRSGDPCRLHAVLDENAIARITDPAIRRDQLSHLMKMARRRNAARSLASIRP